MQLSLEISDLQSFKAVAEMASFRKAAESVYISQPALTRRIQKLEENLGVVLFQRSTRQVKLTVVGREFLQTVHRVLNELESSLIGLRETAAFHQTQVVVATVPSTAYYYLPQIFKLFAPLAPNVKIRLFDASANDVLDSVIRGEAEFGINFMGSQAGEIEFRPLLQERFVVACQVDHALAQRKRVTWRELAKYELITVGRTSGNRLIIEQAIADLRLELKHRYETQHVTTTLGLVEAGLGLAVVPSLAMPHHDHPLLTSVPLFEPTVQRTLGLIRRRGRPLPPAAQQLYDFILKSRKTTPKRAPRV